ncbi:TVP38/TMEM64 family protein [Nitratireductor sp. CH_MIT9313-5]|uniref:TVP38/TMEM64 family protein n=1 Tax=Nitratireductor sp. CH_MIT9313-5 TaxID=3107764 RepID=UPI00300B2411
MTMTVKNTQGGQIRSLTRFLPLALVVALLIAAYALGLHEYLSLSALSESRDGLKELVANHPLLTAFVFFLLYAAAVALSFPAASAMTVAAGFLFGWVYGGLIVLMAATLGATLIFLAARSAFRDSLRAKLGGVANKLASGFEEGAFEYLLILRLAPVVPFWVVNIAPAFFDVRLKTYVTATALGILPGTFAFAYLGRGLDSVLISASASGETLSVGDLVTPQITIAFAALAAVAALSVVVKKMRKPQEGTR